jgi:type IV secretion system protein VirB9
VLPQLGMAEIAPNKSPFDTRVRVIDYNKMDVVKLSTFYGVSTHVQFASDESIKDVAVGDDTAWNIVPRDNHLFIKPKARKADTNITVVTNKRVYNFALVVASRSVKDSTAWKDPNLVYDVSFRYPEEERTKLAAELEAKTKVDEIKRRRDLIKSKFTNLTKDGSIVGNLGEENGVPLENQNYNYWMAGSPELSPTAARDDGRFTYLAFSHNRDMPAVYSVDAAGKEALINTNVEGNTIIIHRVIPKLVLRKGDSVVCIRNNAFDLNGGADNKAGTIAPDIERVIKDPN